MKVVITQKPLDEMNSDEVNSQHYPHYIFP